jgi:steroid delta-isomerase-like uncharacterized protein
MVQDDDTDLLEIMVRHIDAWNRHDVDGLMSLFADDCVFEASGGQDVCGSRYAGAAAVRGAFLEVLATLPDAHWGHGRHHAFGPDDGVSEWTLTGTLADGRRLEVNGCDFLTVRDGRIVRKNSFRKQRPPFSVMTPTEP